MKTEGKYTFNSKSTWKTS